IAELVQHFGNAAHADAADADEMHHPDGLRHLHGRAPSLNRSTGMPEAIASVRSASNFTASGLPTARAASAIEASPSGSFISEAIIPLRTSVESSDCLRTM